MAEGGLPPGMPPANEPGAAMLPMFERDLGEWLQGFSTQTLITAATSPRDGVTTSALGVFGSEQSHMQLGTQVETERFGVFKADLMPQGMLQTTMEGFSPLPFLGLNTQLAFVSQGFAGGVLQTMLMTPIAMISATANTASQLSAEAFTAFQPGPSSQVMLGAHAWGLPGIFCGHKVALEWQHREMDGEKLVAMSTVALACTSPVVAASGAPLATPQRSVTMSAVHRLSEKASLSASLDLPANGDGSMKLGGSRQLSESTRLRGMYGTRGVLALALEMAADHSTVNLAAEFNTKAGAGLAPKFGATISLSP